MRLSSFMLSGAVVGAMLVALPGISRRATADEPPRVAAKADVKVAVTAAFNAIAFEFTSDEKGSFSLAGRDARRQLLVTSGSGGSVRCAI